jgi:hypothetical protein
LARVERLWPGETIACLATGPSLNQADCDYLRGRVRVICINDSHRLAPWADVLYSSDRRWWPHYKGVPSFEGSKFGVGSGQGKANPFTGYPEIRVLKNTGYSGLEIEPNGLRTGRNSGYAAINLAVHLGAARILLLGYNMSHQNGSHFFGNHPAGLNQSAALYPGFRRSFDSLVEPLKAAGIEVINCTPNTSLHTFPRRALRDVLPLPESAVA